MWIAFKKTKTQQPVDLRITHTHTSDFPSEEVIPVGEQLRKVREEKYSELNRPLGDTEVLQNFLDSQVPQKELDELHENLQKKIEEKHKKDEHLTEIKKEVCSSALYN